MDLVRDVLDKRVVDRNGRDMGRVDRVVLQVDTGQPPRVTGIEIGLPPLAHRLGRLAGCLADALVCALGVSEGSAVRLPVAEILDIDNDVRVDVAVGKTAAAAIEQRLRRWVGTFPRRS
jgi:hypothetical protein